MSIHLRALEDVASLVGGGTPSRAKPEYFGGNVPWVTPTDLPPIGTVRFLGSVSENITEAGLRNSSAKLVPPGSVLFSSRASIGKIAVTNRECATNQGFCNFVPKRDVLDPWYLAYYLSSETDNIAALAGKTTFKEVSRKKLRSFSIPVPSLEEQHRIVARIKECMERIDEIRILRSEGLHESQTIESALFHDFLHEGQECSEEPIGAVAAINPRRDSALKSMDDQLAVTFVPMAAVDEVSGTIAKPEIRFLGELRKGFTPFHNGDVIFAKITPCMQNGKSAVAKGLSNGLGFGSTEFHVIRPGAKVLSKWLWYYIRQRSVREEAQRYFRGSAGQQRVPADFLRNLGIPVPPIEEQRRVLSRIDACMERLKFIRTGLRDTDADHLSGAILQKAFSGCL